LAFDQDVDKRFAIEGQRHRLTQLRFIKRRGSTIDDQVTAAVICVDFADRIRHLALLVAQQGHRHAIGQSRVDSRSDEH